MIDFSHANSNKDYTRQALVCHDVAAQIAGGNRNIIGVMMESNLVAGAQKIVPGKPLVYGQSVTDACIDWPETHALLSRACSRGAGPPAAHGLSSSTSPHQATSLPISLIRATTLLPLPHPR